MQPISTDFTSWRSHLERHLHHGSQRLMSFHPCTRSTQDVAKQLIADKGVEADGAIIVADEQTHGRGRLGRSWSAPPGACLLLSCVYVCPHDRLGIEMMSPACALAVAEALEQVTPPRSINVGIKWPNDLLVRGAKIAGLLLETVKVDTLSTAVIVGIGINVSLTTEALPLELREGDRPVTSLTMLGCPTERWQVLTAVVQRLDERLDSPRATESLHHPHDEVLTHYRRRCVLLGQTISVRCDGCDYRGEVIDLDPLVGLLLRTEQGNVVHLPAATSTIVRG